MNWKAVYLLAKIVCIVLMSVQSLFFLGLAMQLVGPKLLELSYVMLIISLLASVIQSFLWIKIYSLFSRLIDLAESKKIINLLYGSFIIDILKIIFNSFEQPQSQLKSTEIVSGLKSLFPSMIGGIEFYSANEYWFGKFLSFCYPIPYGIVTLVIIVFLKTTRTNAQV
jgi:hypothetical protein